MGLAMMANDSADSDGDPCFTPGPTIGGGAEGVYGANSTDGAEF